MTGAERVVTVTVKPGRRHGTGVVETEDGSLLVSVREPALEGKATAAALAALAEHFGLPKSRVSLVSGAASRVKRVRIQE